MFCQFFLKKKEITNVEPEQQRTKFLRLLFVQLVYFYLGTKLAKTVLNFFKIYFSLFFGFKLISIFFIFVSQFLICK